MFYNVKYIINVNVMVIVEDMGRMELGKSLVIIRFNFFKVNKIVFEWIFFWDISGILGIFSLYVLIFVV